MRARVYVKDSLSYDAADTIRYIGATSHPDLIWKRTAITANNPGVAPKIDRDWKCAAEKGHRAAKCQRPNHCSKRNRNGMEFNWGSTDGPALRLIEIYCANPRYGMSCMPQIPYAHRPNHDRSVQSTESYTIPASANSPKAHMSVRGETPPPSRSASGAIVEAIQHRSTTFHGSR
ncbi:hypothetical protein ANN_15306 [Periplaneta americana]|uniref:Uncharacterized protein n=1 Tax=Periplaneta americana TaxID=6978 RepID=A0ABQ8SG04_PERAM|nr:hypothetical protein ANN_15306 [Periplaneta americana]